MKKSSVDLRKCAISIFDRNLPNNICDEIELNEISDSYISKIIGKISVDIDCKMGTVKRNMPFDSIDFLNKIYRFLQSRLDNKNSCLFLCEYFNDNKTYIGYFRVEYQKELFTNLSRKGEINIYYHEKILPSAARRVKEYFVLCTNNNEVRLSNNNDFREFLEKNFDIDFERTEKEKMNLIEDAVKDTILKSYDAEIAAKKIIEYKKVLAEEVQESGELVVEDLLDTVFSDSSKAQELYGKQLDEKGISGDSFEISPQMEKQIKKKYKIKTNNGIEIIVPIDLLDQSDLIEYIQDDNGKISVIIRDIGGIID